MPVYSAVVLENREQRISGGEIFPGHLRGVDFQRSPSRSISSPVVWSICASISTMLEGPLCLGESERAGDSGNAR
jgi:hypothetical protein